MPAEWLVTVGDAIMEATSVAYTFKHLIAERLGELL
jgi:hypothetical protein